MRAGPTFDQERVSFNLVRLKKHGEVFEIVVDPDLAIANKEGKKTDVKEVLKAEKIFSDAKKGLLASEEHMQTIFKTTNPLHVAAIILEQGDIQLTAEYRMKIRVEKQNKLMEKIRRQAVDPKTGLPHPAKRIELAFEEAKIRIDETRSVESQIKEVIAKLQPVLPLRVERALFCIHIGKEHAHHVYGTLKNFGTLTKEEWLPDGSFTGYVEIPAGMQNELIDAVHAKTHGSADIEKVNTNGK